MTFEDGPSYFYAILIQNQVDRIQLIAQAWLFENTSGR